MMRFVTAALLAALALMVAVPGPAAAQTATTLRDAQKADVGAHLLMAQPWCPRWHDPSLKEGRDYRNTLTYETPGVPENVQITWRWPNTPSKKCGVQGYNHVAWGNYDNGSEPSPVQPRQVKAISDLTFSYGIDYAGDPAGFNGLLEFYLTSAAGRADLKRREIGFFWQAPAATQAWQRGTRRLGTWTDRFGKRWTVAIEEGGDKGGFITFIPATGYQGWGTIDAKGALDWLRARGLVDGDWWFNGAAVGIEPIKGFGIAMVRSFRVTVR